MDDCLPRMLSSSALRAVRLSFPPSDLVAKDIFSRTVACGLVSPPSRRP